MAAVEAEIGKSKHKEDEIEKSPDEDVEDDVGTQDPEKKKKKRKKKKKAAGEVGKYFFLVGIIRLFFLSNLIFVNNTLVRNIFYKI